MSRSILPFVRRAISSVKAAYHLAQKGVPLAEATSFSYELYNSNLKDAFTTASCEYLYYEIAKRYGGLNNATRELLKFREERTFDPHKKSHISLEDSKELIKEDRGKLFASNKVGFDIHYASEEEIKVANLFAIGGIDFDNRKILAALLKSIYKLQSLTINPHPLWYCKPLALHPYVSKAERYDEAVKYSLDLKYFSAYSAEFVERYILPRIIKPEDGSVSSPERDIVLFSFSVGGRDIMMIENALRSALQSKGVTKEKIHEVFSKIRGVCLGFAVDVDGLGGELQFTKFILFSTSDTGVLIPRETQKLINYGRHQTNPVPCTFVYNEESKSGHIQYFVVISPEDELFPMDDVYNWHGLNSYIKAISKSESLRDFFAVGLHSATGERELLSESLGHSNLLLEDY